MQLSIYHPSMNPAKEIDFFYSITARIFFNVLNQIMKAHGRHIFVLLFSITIAISLSLKIFQINVMHIIQVQTW